MEADVERARLGQPLGVVAGAGDLTVGLAAVGTGLPGALAGTEAPTQMFAAVPPVTPVGREVEPRPSSSRTVWYVVLGVAVVAALALAFFIGRGIFTGNAADIAVPDLTGLTHAQVVQQLNEHGLALGTENSVTSDKPISTAIGQSPAALTMVAKNTVVDVTYSSGPGTVTVPTLVGLTQQQAVDALVAAGLTTGSITQKPSPGQPAGTVIDSTPKTGAAVTKGAPVSLVVSSGLVPVPNVVGETQVQAKADLANAGFVPAVISAVTSAATAGTVISQNPAAGTPFGQNKTVTITVAVAPPPPTQSPTPSQTPTSSATPSG